MATTTQERPFGAFGTQRRFLHEIAAGTGSEAFVGGAAVVLAIIGLGGMEPFYMAAIATLAIGAALLIEGGVWIANQVETAQLGAASMESSRVTSEFLGGCAVIVLGILALVGVVPQTLLSVALLVAGASLLFGMRMFASFQTIPTGGTTEHPAWHEMAREAHVAASGAQALVALAALILGILAVVHIAPLTLTLIGMLVLGGSMLLNGSAMTTWFLTGSAR